MNSEKNRQTLVFLLDYFVFYITDFHFVVFKNVSYFMQCQILKTIKFQPPQLWL